MKLTKDQELQIALRPGDMIIATETAYFEYNEEVRKQHIPSQQPGHIVMVDNTNVVRSKDTGEIYHIGNSVSGTGINGTSHTGRNILGLGSSLVVGKFRRATPDDPGFMGTRETFELHYEEKIRKLTLQNNFYFVVGLACVTMGLWLLGAIL